MSIAGIHKSVEGGESSYSPDAIPDNDVSIEKGTRIGLTKIKRQRLGRGASALRRRLARRFSVIGEKHNFSIVLDGRPIQMSDRGDLPVIQFLWELDGTDLDKTAAANVLETDILPNRLEAWSDGKIIRGWIGTVSTPSQLDSEDAGNLNGIVVHARGRLFHENILDKLNDGRLYTKYLTGQIEADFLDADDQPDIATSDRQRVQEDDPRYTDLIVFLKSSLVQVEKRWTEWRKMHEVAKAKEESPALRKWFESLPDGYRKNAEDLIAKLSALPIENKEDQKVMYKHGVLAFERMKLRGSTEDLVNNIHDINFWQFSLIEML